ncbi:MaoC family dehydratase N-terminal domain-containing protein [Halobacillus litoralis]|uniref:MaoC family dehydratase N-terminal domain-containing protein n=1 Tax=Halobacillus litoralis TaxID=45668 RepID=UPI001CD2FA55|nr:MaoC family dehydratase N-terminal domain-containing protein [Halobacillus litoralis]MCA1021169.1 MaoC family dehydratase N-terminal domain-containing protein [Halobacillus litoralis]
MFKEAVGKKSRPVKNVVERGAVKKFAEAIGDPHPLFTDEEAVQRNIAPPTFPRVFEYGGIEGLHLPEKGLIHGEQHYHYNRPLYVGEEVFCYAQVDDYYERNGRSGDMGFLKVKRYGEDIDGRIIFSEEQVVIITEAVRKGMNV